MKNTMNRFITLIFIAGTILACSNSQSQKVEGKQTLLPDSLFSLKNLQTTELINSLKYINEKLYLDSSRKIEFVELDKSYKTKILAPILQKDLGVQIDYVNSFMTSHFISKQQKVGEFQPIIIYTSGDDYSSLILAVVDSTLTPISHLLLSGGQFAGPYEVNDSLSCWGEDKQSVIKGQRIKSYKLNTYVWTYSRNDSAFVDSIIYQSRILENGRIETDRLDSIRLIKNIKK